VRPLSDAADDETPGNPLTLGLEPLGEAPPCGRVVFGASGDLTARKLLPALAQLAVRRELPGAFGVVGVARTEWDDVAFRRFAGHAVAAHAPQLAAQAAVWEDLIGGFRYVAGEYDCEQTFARVAEVVAELDRARGVGGSVLHYLAVPAAAFVTVVEGLGRHGLHRPRRGGGFARVVIEKPYGSDLASAQALDERVHGVFDEAQVYRIDHYLGKETVQNLLALRFANAIFEPLWNGRYVASVQVTVAESDGVGHRAGFYEQTGALRDIVQNHVMQVLALTLMEPPATMDPDGIRDEKVKVLRAVDTMTVEEVADEVVRGQYGAGRVDGHPVPGYRAEPGVAPRSTTETFVALRLRVENWRWEGVPIFVRTGKRLPRRVTEVAVEFKPAPHVPFPPGQARDLGPNVLVLHIQPDEGISLRFGAKVPGRGFEVRSVSMDFLYDSGFRERAADAYERLLLDALMGDPTLFIRSDEVMQAWRIVAPIQAAWAADDEDLACYSAGTWGPAQADQLLARHGHRWHEP
jgi:glucose-6-phosphate 1-dehydrogenase